MSLSKLALIGLFVASLWLAGCSPSTRERKPPSDRANLKPEPAALPATNDWPQWRCDAAHTAATPFGLPDRLQLQWVRHYAPRVQTWDDPLNNDLMTYDRIFEPVVMGNLMFVGFNDSDKVVALDIGSGKEVWTFYTDGPVRLPATTSNGKVYFCSDDGSLYCVNGDDGKLLWKFRGGPSDRKALGNRRVISSWPARGGPVVTGGKVYFAASIWPFMGTFIHALDAETGKVVWSNDSTGSQYIKQPHSTPSFAGVAPQGPLTTTRDYLLVPGGRSVPAVFDRLTGRFLHFQLEDSGKGNGGSFVAAGQSEYYVHTRKRGTRAHDLKTGKKDLTFVISEPVITTNRLFSAEDHSFFKAAVVEAEQKLAAAHVSLSDSLADVAKAEDEADKGAYKTATNTLASSRRKVLRAETNLLAAIKTLGTNYPGPVIQAVGADKKPRWEFNADGSGDMILAGKRLYAAGTNAIIALDTPQGTNRNPILVWSNAVDGRVLRLLAAQDHLFAVTLDGRILCYGSEPREAAVLRPQAEPLRPGEAALARAKELTSGAGAEEGYALCYGAGDGTLVEALVEASKLHVTIVDEDATVIEKLRRRFDAAGVYGTRVAAHLGDPLTFQAPPYVANLVVVQGNALSRLSQSGGLSIVYASVRPYGGWLWIADAPDRLPEIRRQVDSAQLAQARVEVAAGGVAVLREGALPGSSDWTHMYGNIANTLKSDDTLVKLPLGVLWFGGPTHMDVLPRHGHGPSEQVVGGRLFIQGMSSLSARDVYTGRVLWKREFGDLGNFGVYYDATYTNMPLSTIYNQKHIPGANARGVNFVVMPDAIYLAVSNVCLVLDPRTGGDIQIIRMPSRPDDATPPQWGFLGVYENILLGGQGFMHYSSRLQLSTNRVPPIVDLSASRALVAMDRKTGEVLWQKEAKHGFIHNGIVAGGGRVYVLDRQPRSVRDKLKRRGQTPPKDYTITAFDARTGGLAWLSTNVYGTFLSYSKAHDVLVQSGATTTDRLKDESTQGLGAFRGRDGKELWSKPDLKYNGPCILHGELVMTTPGSFKTNAGAFRMVDGKVAEVTNPVTGRTEPLRIYRAYGCNHPIACENLITFRSGAAGFYDLETHSGTGNLGGFKSSCSANLIAADGVLNAPDYTRTCTCPYQNQTSLAFVHTPDPWHEVWTHNQFGVGVTNAHRIVRLGINFGAPGDRLSEDGTLWVDHPSVGGSSQYVYLATKGPTNYYCRHASLFSGTGPAWVMASGVVGADLIQIGLETTKPAIQPTNAPARKKTDEEDDRDPDEEEKNGKANGTNATNIVKGAKSKTNEVVAVFKARLAPATYTVRLYFAEPEDLRPGERVFGVALQGQAVLKGFDIVAIAGCPRKGIIREYSGILVKDLLTIRMTRAKDSKYEALLCGVEMLLEEKKLADSSKIQTR